MPIMAQNSGWRIAPSASLLRSHNSLLRTSLVVLSSASQLVTNCLTLFLGWRLKLFLGLFTASRLFHTFPSFNCRREFYFVLFLAPGYGPFPPRLRIWCLSGVLDQRLLWKVPPPALPSFTAMPSFLAMPPCSPSWLNFWMSWTKGVTGFMFSYLIQSSSKQHQFKMHSNEYSCSFSSVCCHKLWNHCKVNVLTVQSCFYRCNCFSGAPVLAVWPRYWLCMLAPVLAGGPWRRPPGWLDAILIPLVSFWQFNSLSGQIKY